MPLYVLVLPSLDTPLYGQMPPHVLTPPVCLDAPQLYRASKGMRDIQTYRGVKTYRRHPNVWGIWTPPQSDKACFLSVVYVQQASKHLPNIHLGIQTYGSVQTYRRHPNIGVLKLTGAYIWGCPNKQGASKCMGGIWTPPQSDKACFLFVVYADIQTSSKHTQGHPNIWECPNIQEVSKQRSAQTYRGLSKHWGIQTYKGCIQIYAGIQIYGGVQTWGHSNIQGAIQRYGGTQAYREHPNIWGCPSIYLKSDHHQILSRKVETRFCSSSG